MSCAKCGTSHAPDVPCPPPDGFAPSPDAAFDAILAGLDALGAAPPAWRTERPPPPPLAPASGAAFSERDERDFATSADAFEEDDDDQGATFEPASTWRPGDSRGAVVRPPARPAKPRSKSKRIPWLLFTSLAVGVGVYVANAEPERAVPHRLAESAVVACDPEFCEPLDHAFVSGLPFGSETDVASLRAALPALGPEVKEIGASADDPALGLYGPHPARQRVSGPASLGGIPLDCEFDLVPDHGLHMVTCTTGGAGYDSRDALDVAVRDVRDALTVRFGDPVVGEGPAPRELPVAHTTWTWGAPPDDIVLHSLWLDDGANARGAAAVIQRSHAPSPVALSVEDVP